MKLSVIIPAFNSLHDVIRCAESVRRTTAREHCEILVQDDASPELNLLDYIPGPFNPARNAENLGFPGNCNAGAARATGDVLMFVNQDVIVTQPGWAIRLLEWFDEVPEMGIAGPTLLFPHGAIQSVGGAFDARLQPYHEALGYVNRDWKPINTPRAVSWVTGAALAIRRELWQALGGFDTVYGRGYFEDVDLCIRAAQFGAETWHLPGIVMTHRVGSTGGSPHFGTSAQAFKARWVDTNLIEADTNSIKERYW